VELGRFSQDIRAELFNELGCKSIHIGACPTTQK